MSDRYGDTLDRHIDTCDTCGNGEGVCLEGYLMAVSESSEANK